MIAGTPPAEFDIDADLACALLRREHPDLAELPITPMESGWDNVMFRLGDDLAMRLPRRSAAAQLIEHEQRWLPTLAARLPLATPAPIRTGAPGLGYPWRWSVAKWLPGSPADLCPPAADQAAILARFLRSLHIPAPTEAPRNLYRGVPLEARAAVVHERMARLRVDTAAINSAVERAWRDALRAPLDACSTWIHGDLHARNVLVHDGRFSAVIDWGDLAQGDRATDLACVWLLLPDAATRQRTIAELSEVSHATWTRARGWAVFFGVTLLETGRVNDSRNAVLGETVLRRIHAGP